MQAYHANDVVGKMSVSFDKISAADAATPLEAVSYSSDGLLMQELSLAGKISLRGDFNDPRVAAAVQDTLGLAVDLQANTFLRNNERSIYWLGPDERIIYTDLMAVDNEIAQLRSALPGNTSVVEVSDYFTVIRLSGEKVRPVLGSGTPLDLHNSVFSKGQCAQTRFGTASVLLSVHDDIPVIDLQVRWSFAEYVWAYLCKVADYC